MSDKKTTPESLLKVLNYTTKILFPKYPPHFFPFYTVIRYMIYLKHRLDYKIRLKLHPIPVELYNILIDQINPKHVIGDNSELLIVPKNIYNSIKKQHNWFNISLFSKNLNTLNTEHKWRNIQVVPLQLDQCCAFLTETHYFNLKRYFNVTDDNFFITLEQSKENYIPTIAKTALISVVNNPFDVTSDLVNTLLINYFTKPKLLQVDYIYNIKISPSTCGEMYYKYLNFCDSSRFIYFKCLNLGDIDDNKSFFVVKNVTELSEKQYISSYIPVMSRDFVEIPSLNSNEEISTIKTTALINDRFIPLCPFGLQIYGDKLKNSLEPFIRQNNLIKIEPTFLLQAPRGSGKSIIVEAVAKSLGVQLLKVDCSNIMCMTTPQSEARLKYLFNKIKVCCPIILALESFQIFGLDHEDNLDTRFIHYFQTELKNLLQNNRFPIFLIALSNEKPVPPTLKRIFLETITIESLNMEQRLQTLRWLDKKYNISLTNDILKSIAEKTGGFLFEDLSMLILNAKKKSYLQKHEKCTEEHFDIILDEMHAAYSDSIGAAKVPKVNWTDIGGLANLKQEIIKTINMPNMSISLLGKSGSKRSGILLYGPPGTGKTLLAKAIATESKYNFLSVKGPELLNMYVGQSEQNIRDVFERARSASPCVIFFDELDSLAPNRGAAGDSGGVMDRVVSQLLSEMDGIADSKTNHTLFIVGATNRPDLIDPALLRPGRFDKLLYVGLCDTVESKQAVIETLTNKFNVAPNVNSLAIANILEGELTGADLYSVCSKAWMSAVRNLIKQYEEGLISKEQLSAANVIVTLDNFMEGIESFVPSVNENDMTYFKQVQREISGK